MDGDDRTLLTPSETSGALAGTPFEQVDRMLVGGYRTRDFVSAVQLLNAVTDAAEAAGHHPDVHLGWGRVSFELSSHDVGGVTPRDVRLARQIDRIARELTAQPL